MPHVISIMVKKGGVAKTTTAVNLAAALTLMGKTRVLIVDLDSQFNATERLFQREAPDGQSAADGIEKLDLHINPKIYVVQTGWARLDLLPANASHTLIEKRMPETGDALRGLKYFVDTQGGNWDWIIIDCPNNFHTLTLNAFVASQGVIIPVDLDDEGSIRAVPSVLNTVEQVRLSENPGLSVWGILLTKFGPKTSLVQTSLHSLKSDPVLDKLLMKTHVRKSQHIKNANAYRTPAVFKFPNNEYVQDYLSLAKEVASHAREKSATAQGLEPAAKS